MSVLLPVSLIAQDVAGAILHTNDSGVLVNKSSVPDSTAIFPNDLVETPKGGVARIDLPGSNAQINGETMVQFEADELALDHGSISVNTNRGLRVRVGCITVTPVNDAVWTQYDVIDTNGRMTVNALKSDVYIDAHEKNLQPEKGSVRRERTIVHEGEQKSRDEKCVAGYVVGRAVTPGLGAIMNSAWAKWTALGMIGAITCLGVCHDDDPISPHKP